MLYLLNLNLGGEGAFASVHPGLEVDDETGAVRQVAVKQPLPPDKLAALLFRRASGEPPRDSGWLARRLFDRERAEHVKLAHPNLVRSLRAARLEGGPVLVLEYIHGADLAWFIEHERALPVLEVIDVLRQVGAALSHLHRVAGLVHGDLHAGNILFDGLGRILVSDFGLALRAGDQDEHFVAIAKRVVPPEELEHPVWTHSDGSGRVEPAPDARGDVWSLGLWAALALRGHALRSLPAPGEKRVPTPPEPGEAFRAPYDVSSARDPGALVEDCLESAFGPAPSALREELRSLLGDMLAEDPADRPADGGVVLERLRGGVALADAVDRLRRRDVLRRGLLVRRDWDADRAGDRLEVAARELAALQWPRPEDASLLPDDEHVLARAAWTARQRTGRTALANVAAESAIRCQERYGEDARVASLAFSALTDVLGTRPGAAEELVRAAEIETEAFGCFGSFVRAQGLREMRTMLTALEPGAASGRDEAVTQLEAALAAFDAGLLERFEEFTGRLPR